MTQKLCGSFIHFYACKNREARGGRGRKGECLPMSKGYLPGSPFRCGASEAEHGACPHADLDGSKHREAGIDVTAAKGAT